LTVLHESPTRLVAVMLLCFFVFSVLNMMRTYLGFGIMSADFTIFEQVFYSIGKGNGFYSTFEGGSHLGVHFSPVLLLFAPLVWLAKSLTVLIALHIGLTAIAMWWLFRYCQQEGDTGAGLVVVIMLMLHSTLTHNTRIFYELALLPLPFVGVFINYEKQRFAHFFGWLLALTCIRENLFVMIAAWGLLAFSFGRRGRWVWAPLALAASHFVVANLVTPLLFPHSLNVSLLTCYQEYGNTAAEIYANLKANPFLPFAFLFHKKNVVYLLGVLLPFLVLLPFCRRWWLPALPTLGFILFASGSRVILPTYHYSIEVVLWLGLSTLMFLRDQSGFFASARIQRVLPKLCLLMIVAFVYRGGDALLRLKTTLNSTREANFGIIQAHIPPHASLLAEGRFCNRLARRDHIYFLDLQNPVTAKVPADFALLEGEPTYAIPETWRPHVTAGGFRLYRVLRDE